MTESLEKAVNDLQPKQVAFAIAYAHKRNATQASKIAGYSSSQSQLVHDPRIQNLIKLYYQNTFMGADEALSLLARRARITMDDFVTIDDDGQPVTDLVKARTANAIGAIKKLRTKSYYNDDGKRVVDTQFELFDPMESLKLVAKDLGLAQEQINIKISDSINILLDIVQDNVDPETYERILREIQARAMPS